MPPAGNVTARDDKSGAKHALPHVTISPKHDDSVQMLAAEWHGSKSVKVSSPRSSCVERRAAACERCAGPAYCVTSIMLTACCCAGEQAAKGGCDGPGAQPLVRRKSCERRARLAVGTMWIYVHLPAADELH